MTPQLSAKLDRLQALRTGILERADVVFDHHTGP